jgi:hypothetical protein
MNSKWVSFGITIKNVSLFYSFNRWFYTRLFLNVHFHIITDLNIGFGFTQQTKKPLITILTNFILVTNQNFASKIPALLSKRTCFFSLNDISDDNNVF